MAEDTSTGTSEATATTESTVVSTETTEATTSTWWKTMLTSVLKSKLFWTTVVGAVSVGSYKIFGYDVDADTQTSIVDTIMTFVGGS